MGKLICTIELLTDKGLTIKVEDPDGKLTQTVTLDGKAITLEVKSSSDTSTIVQKADSVTVTSKNFTVKSDTITLEAKEAISATSKKTLKLQSTEDMSFTSEKQLTVKSTKDTTLSSEANIELSATKDFALKGKAVQLTAKADMALAGKELKLDGKSKVEVGAPTIKVAAKIELGLESSAKADLKGSITSVSGSVVKLG